MLEVLKLTPRQLALSLSTLFVPASGIIWLLALCLKVLESVAKEGKLHLQIPFQEHEKMSENSHILESSQPHQN